MSALALLLHADAYELTRAGRVLARLAGGPAALVPAAGGPLRDADIEAAIEQAEDWLMPFSKSLQGLELRVQDSDGRLHGRLGSAATLTPAEVEHAFTRAFDDVAFGRPISREVLADIVLVRELVHHGGLSAVML